MQLYANVGGKKQLPFPKGRGSYPCCGRLLIAKCGQINAHHWAHESHGDCDSWSEPIGPWHLWWQGLVRSEFVEVVKGPHRADIFNGRTVIELQHSSISAEEIAAREAFYGDMIWLFDATQRFAYVKSGERAFFSFGQAKHLDLCEKPVFLDFGFDIVQVEQSTDAINMVSGFGRIRSREWFTSTFFSDVRRPDTNAVGPFVPEARGSDPWCRKSPVWKLKDPTKWIEAGQTVTYPKWTEYIWLRYGTPTDKQNTLWDYEKVIDCFPDIANGWTREGVRQMMGFLRGRPVILSGLLRVLPNPALMTQAKGTVSATEHLLHLADEHIQAGRLPILEDSIKEALLENARREEISQYGRLLRVEAAKSASSQKSLFD